MIAGFASPRGVIEEIDLIGFSFTGANETFTQSGTSGTLTVTNSAGQTVNLNLLGTYSTANFTLSSDGHGGTVITDAVSASTGAATATMTNVATVTQSNVMG